MTIIARHTDDELLLLASDGLWDVMNNQEACTLAKKCLQRARQRGATRAVSRPPCPRLTALELAWPCGGGRSKRPLAPLICRGVEREGRARAAASPSLFLPAAGKLGACRCGRELAG